jgi:hypothetical protein
MTTNSNDRYRKGERARRPKETNKFIVHITAKGEAARKRYGDHFSLTKKRPSNDNFLWSSVLFEDNEGQGDSWVAKEADDE